MAKNRIEIKTPIGWGDATACDNQLLLVAYQGNAAYQICDIQSGYVNPVDVTINIEEGPYDGPIKLNGVTGPLKVTETLHLPKGDYGVTYAGINWGNIASFAFNLNGTDFNIQKAAPNGEVGVRWAQSSKTTPDALKITV